MFAIVAAIFFGVATLETGAGGGHDAWTSPAFFIALGLTFVAAHLATGWWPHR